MVKITGSTEYERLDAIMRAACERHGLKLMVEGWARKTYDVYLEDKKTSAVEHYARVESFATTSGEIRIFTDAALPFAEDVGGELEKAFEIGEAVIIRDGHRGERFRR